VIEGMSCLFTYVDLILCAGVSTLINVSSMQPSTLGKPAILDIIHTLINNSQYKLSYIM